MVEPSHKPRQMVLYAQAGILVPLIVTTIIAIAIGGGEGFMSTKLSSPSAPAGAPGHEAPVPAPAAHAPPAHAPAPDAHGEKPKEGKGEHGAEKGKPVVLKGTIIRELPPIVTNIALPEDVWIRLETSLVFDAEKLHEPDVAIKEISSDILAYLRTLSLPQVQGARGLRHLREDLNERVAIRTEGKVKELLIQGMVVQ